MAIDRKNFIGLKSNLLKAFSLGVVISFCFFIPFILSDNGYFLYYGDFNVQQIPFYQMIHDAIKSGNYFWSFTTDLGANTIGSYSFYLLGSPFFWLTLLFDSNIVPYLMGPLLILKFGCASLTAYVYISRYVVNKEYALLGGMLYTFSGFSIYNIFFNHFHEAIVIFPLVLAALDEYLINKNYGIFIWAIFASCLFNYYFFVGQVVFCFIYCFIKIAYSSYKIRFKDFIVLFCEGIIGVGLTAFILIPTIMCVIQNPRVDNPPYGWNSILYSYEQRYLHIIECFFFPPDIPARPNFTPNSEAKWASLGAWLPLFSMTGVIAWCRAKKRNWLKTIIILLFFMSMVPILNSAFQGFNASYYARWFYMITLMTSLATVMALESTRVKWRSSVLWTLCITLAIAIPIGLFPDKDKKTGNLKIGLMEYSDRFWIYVAIALISLLLLTIVLNKFKNNKKFTNYLILGTAFISIIYSIFVIGLGKTQSYDTHGFIIPYCLNNGENINLPDKENCRIDVYDGMDNQAMFWQIPSIQAFHSIVPGSIIEFYPTIGVKRDVASRPDIKLYGLRALTSCRWLFVYNGDIEFKKANNENLLPGFEFYDNQNGFDIMENKYFIPFGFSYENYITREQYNNIDENNRHLALLKGVVLDDEVIIRNNDILKPIHDIGNLPYTKADYFNDCEKLRNKSSINFSRDNKGFSCDYEAGEKDDLVFFSVPFENGWSATINGEPVIIEKANIGFMAIRVKAGQINKIRFNYYPPGLNLGILITICSVIVLITYVCLKKKIASYLNKDKRKLYRIKNGVLPKPEGVFRG